LEEEEAHPTYDEACRKNNLSAIFLKRPIIGDPTSYEYPDGVLEHGYSAFDVLFLLFYLKFLLSRKVSATLFDAELQ
jgi:hypothetical protein